MRARTQHPGKNTATQLVKCFKVTAVAAGSTVLTAASPCQPSHTRGIVRNHAISRGQRIPSDAGDNEHGGESETQITGHAPTRNSAGLVGTDTLSSRMTGFPNLNQCQRQPEPRQAGKCSFTTSGRRI